MSKAQAHVVELRPPEGASERERLEARRQELGAEAARLQKVDAVRADVERQLAELSAEEARLGSSWNLFQILR